MQLSVLELQQLLTAAVVWLEIQLSQHVCIPTFLGGKLLGPANQSGFDVTCVVRPGNVAPAEI